MEKFQTVFVDLQGFRGNSNNFIPKEIAVVFNDKQYYNFIIKPPYEFSYLLPEKKKQANWLTKNHHHLQWEDGYASIGSVCEFINANTTNSSVYVKGLEKKRWLEEMLQKNVFNIENVLCCYNLKRLEKEYPDCVRCSSHSHGTCALKNALLIQKNFGFYFSNFKQNNK